jgi:hypothetical protein
MQDNMLPEVERKYLVEPSEIDASKHLFGAFEHTETEVSAGYIIRMLQEVGEWRPFTREEIEEFYQRSGHTDFWFNALVNPVNERLADGSSYQVGGGYVIERDDGKFEVTEEFVERAFESLPKQA